MKNLTWQNPEQLFVAQELINKVKSKCCGIKVLIKYPVEIKEELKKALDIQDYKIKFMADKGLESCLRITLGRREQTQVVCDTIKQVFLNSCNK